MRKIYPSFKVAIAWLVGTLIGVILLYVYPEKRTFECILGITFVIMGLMWGKGKSAKGIKLLSLIVGGANIVIGVIDWIAADALPFMLFVRYVFFGLWALLFILLDMEYNVSAFRAGVIFTGVLGILAKAVLIVTMVFYYLSDDVIFGILYIVSAVVHFVYSLIYNIGLKKYGEHKDEEG